MPSDTVQIRSLEELEIDVCEDIMQHFVHQYNSKETVTSILRAMKRPPATTICRVNQILSSRKDVKESVNEHLSQYPLLQVTEHKELDDVLCILPKDPTINSRLLDNSRVPRTGDVKFPDWPSREAKGWPLTHRVVICDRFCGEAVLRGSDIFVRGVLAADSGIQAGEKVAVYADIPGSQSTAVPRGLVVDSYAGRCVFVGLGTTACSRSEIFRAAQGVAIYMLHDPCDRVGPCLPPLSGILEDKMMLQNLPSVMVGHVLAPRPNDVILDMCAAPGGKSAHLASLIRNQGTIVSCDKSRKKMVAAKQQFERIGATCITPLALDSTKCVATGEGGGTKSVEEVLLSAETSQKDGLKNVKLFFPESFDRILLDPPCSALGLRPKLFVPQASLHDLEKHATYQRKFVGEAVTLLKPGGVLTYSTCTINASENEAMVRHILDEYPCMELLPIGINLGEVGLEHVGLSSDERLKVRRFDPHSDLDTMGFFVALFQKIRTTR